MAALAVVEVGFAKSALAVVTGHAGLGARRREMLRRESRADLASLRQSAPRDQMAAIAVEILPRAVIRVAKANAERASLRAGARVTPGCVTRAAGGDVNSAGLPARRVALITGLVRA